MKTKKLISLVALFLISTVLFANNNNADLKYSLKREIKKNYTANSSSILNIDNKYGDIVINPSNDNSISIVVNITVKSNKESSLESIMNRISIDFSQSGNLISAETNIESNNFSFNNSNYKINYTISAPNHIALSLSNSYGNTTIGDHRGKVTGDFGYGDFNAMNLEGLTSLEIKYGNIDISANAGDMNIDLSYADCHITSVKNINIISKYSKIEIGKADHINFNEVKYDKYSIGTVKSVSSNEEIGYTKINIDKVISSFNIAEIKYGDINISFERDFKQCTIGGRYTPINIKLPSNSNFNYNLETSYAGIDAPLLSNAKQKSYIKESNNITMTGVCGSGGTANVNIGSEYGKIFIEGL